MNKSLICLTLLSSLVVNTYADNTIVNPVPPVPAQYKIDADSCSARSAVLLVGTIESIPVYVGSKTEIEGVVLSHTHILVQPLGESDPAEAYEIAADNVFAAGYNQSQPNQAVPTPLSGLKPGQVIEACGLTYTQTPFKGGSQFNATNGIHWVHANDQVIKPGYTTNGWLKTIDASGVISDNLENNPEYFCLWSAQGCNFPPHAQMPVHPTAAHAASFAQTGLLPW